MARPRSEAARAKMLDAATELLLAAGVRGFNIDEVARRSGVAKTTIYRHFGTKGELLAASLDRFIPIPPTPDTGSLRDDLLEFLEGVRPIFANDALRAVSFEIFTEARREPELRAAYMALMQRRAGPTLTIYTNARDRGEISPDIDYPEALEIIEGPFIVRSLLRADTLYDMDLEALTDRMLVALK
ncbi:MAG: TetR/AcrR family transcriptional regulator [Actinomycetota bacterium]|nr:TetR/AcrR family transcriptional regulator [Actinomycetota bacterium]